MIVVYKTRVNLKLTQVTHKLLKIWCAEQGLTIQKGATRLIEEGVKRKVGGAAMAGMVEVGPNVWRAPGPITQASPFVPAAVPKAPPAPAAPARPVCTCPPVREGIIPDLDPKCPGHGHIARARIITTEELSALASAPSDDPTQVCPECGSIEPAEGTSSCTCGYVWGEPVENKNGADYDAEAADYDCDWEYGQLLQQGVSEEQARLSVKHWAAYFKREDLKDWEPLRLVAS